MDQLLLPFPASNNSIDVEGTESVLEANASFLLGEPNNHHSTNTNTSSHHHHFHPNDDDASPLPPAMKKLKLKDDDSSSFRFQNPSKRCLQRIHSDLTRLYRDPVEGIFVVPDDSRANTCHAIVLGPADTPYEFGFFYFLMEFPNVYPHEPPRVTLQTTGGGTFSPNPNLYRDGKVCLSILGTWSGPSWTPALTIGSVLLSIQSLLNAVPYHNEPGFEQLNRGGRPPQQYNLVIRHECLRVAVLGMVELAQAGKLPEKLSELVLETFAATGECCRYLCDDYKALDGKPFQDPYKRNKGTFRFGRLQARIKELQQKTAAAMAVMEEG